FAEASILFADIVGFTEIAARFSPNDVVGLLNKYFTKFDEIMEKYGIEKIKTIGDAYMAASGIPEPCNDHAEKLMNFAIEILEQTAVISNKTGIAIDLRIGINSGPVTAGVIGTKKFIYDLWGDAVNLASRMEMHGVPGKIQVTPDTYMLLKDKYSFEHRGTIDVKGKGQLNVYLFSGKKDNYTYSNGVA
ncbi:MAG: adenylate/guanylate cyclase domain-containing protein, partial [Spirochaetia bacterium]|nr:adenylate/guanylate cyclase domain-containing protein [Spirochaetia bacterium]